MSSSACSWAWSSTLSLARPDPGAAQHWGPRWGCCYGLQALAAQEPPSSSGLGRLPFTQVTRVRIPLGVRSSFWSRGAVWSARRPVKPEVAGSNPVGTATLACSPPPVGGEQGDNPGRVAQLAERPPEKRKVTGSTPVPTTTRNPAHRAGFRRVSAALARMGRNTEQRGEPIVVVDDEVRLGTAARIVIVPAGITHRHHPDAACASNVGASQIPDVHRP